MAQLVVGLAGAAAGFAIGGPQGAQIGFALGSAVGASLTTQRTYGPRLADLKAPQSTYGAVIPYVEGSIRTAGVWVWTSDKREVASTSSTGGKGGPTIENTAYTYFIDALILLSEDQISGVRRVWSNGKLVWSAVEDATLETLLASDETTSWDAMRVYTGTSNQLPDAVYEAAVGSGNAPGYRGKGYVFIENMALGSSGQIPALTFEVYRGEMREIGEIQPSPVEQSKPGSVGCGAAAFVANGVLQLAVPQWTSSYGTSLVNVYEMDVLNQTSTLVGSYNVLSQYTNAASTGSTDVPVYVQMQGTSAIAHFGSTGTRYSYTTPDDLGSEGVFACIGDDIFFSSRTSSSKKIYRCAKTGGSPLATSGTLPANPTSMVVIRGYVYAAGYNSETVYKLDVATLTLQETLQTPLYNVRNDSIPMVCDLDGELCLSSSSAPPGNTYPVYAYRGGAWDQIGNLEADFGQGQYTSPSLIVAGSVIIGGRINSSPPYKYTVKYATLLGDRVNPNLQDIVARQCERAGLSSSKYDVSALSGTVKGFAVSQLSSPRQVLEMLGTAYTFLTVESGGKLAFRPRGGASVATINYADLGATAGARVEPLPFVRVNDLEVPSQVVVKFANWDNDHQDGAEVADRLLSSLAGAVETVELPMALTATEARRIAEIRTAEVTGSALRVEGLAVDRSLAKLEPGDAITVVDYDGVSAYRIVILRVRDAGLVRQIDGVLEDASAVVSNATTDTNYDSSGQILRRSETVLRLLDIPILVDADDDTGHYAATTRSNNTGSWPGAYLLRGENDADYAQVATFGSRTYIGAVTGTLGAFSGGRVFDEINTLTVTGSGELESYTRENVLNGAARPLLVGSEVLFYRDATMTAVGAYTVRGLLRGMRGTEWAVNMHAASEPVVLLQAGGLQRVQTPTAKVGVEMDFKGVTNGAAADTVDPIAFTNTSIGKRPFAPVDARFTSSGGVTTVSWKRRTRRAVGFTGATGSLVPLGEDAEAYEVDILIGSPPVVVGTLVSTTNSTSLSAASSVLTLAQQVRYARRRSNGTLIGAFESSFNSATNVVRFAADGTVAEISASLGRTVWDVKLDAAADVVYAQSFETDSFGGIITSKITRFAAGNLASATATYSLAAADGNFQLLHWDGTALWSLGYTDNKIRKHNSTTLAVEQTIVVSPPPGGPTFYGQDITGASGRLVIGVQGAVRQVICIDPTGSPTEVWRTTFSGTQPIYRRGAIFDVSGPAAHYVVGLSGGFLIVNADSGAIVLNQSGSQLGLSDIRFSDTEFMLQLSVAADNVGEVRSALDGSLVREFVVPDTQYIESVEPVNGSVITHTAGDPQSIEYSDSVDPVGATVRIYQISSVYGRGLPLEAVVPTL